MGIVDPLNGQLVSLVVSDSIDVGVEAKSDLFVTDAIDFLSIFGTSLVAEDATFTHNIDISIEPQGTGKLILPYATPKTVPIFGTNGSVSELVAMTDGDLIIGSLANQPSISKLTAGAGITIVNTPGHISISSPGVAGAVTAFTTNAGNVLPAAGIVDALGGNNISTSGVGNNLTINLTGTTDHGLQIGNATNSLTSLAVGTNGQVLIAATAANSAFASLASAGSTIVFTTGANTLNLETAGTVPTSFTTDGAAATPAVGVIDIAGGTNITTNGAGNVVTANLDASITLTGVTATAFETDVAAAGLTMSATSIIADGTDANIDIDFTPKGTGKFKLTYATPNSVALHTTGGGFTDTGAMTSGQIVIGSTGALPVAATITDGNNITVTEGAGTLAIAVTGTTNHCPQVGNASGSVTSLAAMTNGQLIIGSVGADPAIATLASADGSVTITNGAGTIDLAASGGGLSWSEVVGVAQAMAVNTGYIANNAGLVTLTLPDTAAVGDLIAVVGKGAGKWSIAQNAAEVIRYGNNSTTVGVAGHLDAALQYDTVELVCITANNDWVVRSNVGNLNAL